MTTDWNRLAHQLGVATTYWDVDGVRRAASEPTLRSVCEMLLDQDADPGRGAALDDVVLVRGGELRSGVRDPLALGHAVLELEDGSRRDVTDVVGDVTGLPVGIHTIRWRDGSVERTTTVLAAPGRFPAWPDPAARQHLAVFAPAYALWDREHTRPSVASLTRLGDATLPLGADTIATLPLYAAGWGDRFESSPYSPVSRFHWNELLIPPETFGSVDANPAPPDRVDWSAELAARATELDDMAGGLTDGASGDLRKYLAERPDVTSYAEFGSGGDPITIRRLEVGQWLAERALAEVMADLSANGQQLALDLPVAARQGSWEQARWPELFAAEACIGAPPDTFFAGGQNWELPALNPAASRRHGHRVWHDVLSTACRYAGVLRIDHIMQVHRLWWIPDGHSADDGVYVHYPADEMLAVAAIVADRTGTLMVGEDLGTVPPEVSERIADWGLVGMYEEVFALHAFLDGHTAGLRDVRPRSWAGIRTHDMPTLAATLADVDDDNYRADLGGELGRSVGGDVRDVAAAMIDRLRSSDAHAVVVDVDDLLGETVAHNRPGIVDDLNWTHRTAIPTSELALSEHAASTLRPRPAPDPLKGTIVNQPQTHVGDLDLHLLFEGSHRRLHEVMGAQPSVDGTGFSVWAPNAESVRVLVDADGWSDDHWLERRGESGVWTGAVGGVGPGAFYHFRIQTRDGRTLDKADPFAAASSEPPSTTSRVADLGYDWGDADWMSTRGERIGMDAPVSIYEVHLGSWGRRLPSGGRRFPTYDELADPLADHAEAHGFTHVELLPVMEHPFYGSWGYQTTGYFCPTARHGTPTQFMAMVDRLHQRGIGVILDWVPSHFPFDAHGLADFDGTSLYEHADPRQGFHPDWNSAVFNYGRNEVRAFLTSSAMCWLERYHVDGLRVDAVASMLYLDYSRAEGEWIPNIYGGRENLEAIAFLRELNEAIYSEHPDVATFAEESTSWPMVSRPTYVGGLGFGYKWDMGWMHDTLQYLQRDSVHRTYHHGEITFRSVYAASENFTLPLSHDEVVHGKGSILDKMPGDEWQKFANMRLLYGMQWGQPGKKLLFMGDELASPREWNHEDVLDWELHDAPGHGGVRRFVAALNELYRGEPAMHRMDCHADGFRWVVGDDAEHSVYVWLRQAPDARPVLIIANATPGAQAGYRIGVPQAGRWVELLCSDNLAYGGSGVHAVGADGAMSMPIDSHGQYQSIVVTVPPLAFVALAPAE